jgi:hypothetical protein
LVLHLPADGEPRRPDRRTADGADQSQWANGGWAYFRTGAGRCCGARWNRTNRSWIGAGAGINPERRPEPDSSASSANSGTHAGPAAVELHLRAPFVLSRKSSHAIPVTQIQEQKSPAARAGLSKIKNSQPSTVKR